jgi:hypothetical protein
MFYFLILLLNLHQFPTKKGTNLFVKIVLNLKINENHKTVGFKRHKLDECE